MSLINPLSLKNKKFLKDIKATWFDVEEEIAKSPETHFFFIVGQRGAGKTFSVKKHVIKEYIEKGKKFVYVRRYEKETKGTLLRTIFEEIEPFINWDPVFDRYKDKDYIKFHILGKGASFYLVGENNDGDFTYLETVGTIATIMTAEQTKGGKYQGYSSIVFDEFITQRTYIGGDDETKFFMKIVNTVGRIDNPELKVFLCGNPDNIIEACPYLYNLKLRYADLQPNIGYYYDSIFYDKETRTKKILGNNICFVKVVISKNTLNPYTANIFDTSEERMSLTGEAQLDEYQAVEDWGDFDALFSPYYELIVEAPMMDEKNAHKKVYVYYGMLWDTAVCVCLEYRRYTVQNSVYCRYERLDFRPKNIFQTYRINIPNLECFSELRKFMNIVDCNKAILVDNNESGTIFRNVKENS